MCNKAFQWTTTDNPVDDRGTEISSWMAICDAPFPLATINQSKDSWRTWLNHSNGKWHPDSVMMRKIPRKETRKKWEENWLFSITNVCVTISQSLLRDFSSGVCTVPQRERVMCSQTSREWNSKHTFLAKPFHYTSLICQAPFARGDILVGVALNSWE